MAEKVSIDELANSMYEMIKEYTGKRKLRAVDLTNEMLSMYGNRTSKEDCRKAIKQLIDSGKCTYEWSGGVSYVVISK